MSASPGLLESGDGRRLLAAQLFDSLGAGVGLVALPWLVLDNGGNASTAGPKAADGGADGRTAKYLVRRLLRIYPLYWVVATAAPNDCAPVPERTTPQCP